MARLVYSMGDPNGLGPELLFLADTAKYVSAHSILIVGPEVALEYHARHRRAGKFWYRLRSREQFLEKGPGIYLYQPDGLDTFSLRPGKPEVQGGFAAGTSLTAACGLLRTDPEIGLVTGPLNKSLLLEAGFEFPGHTEFLAQQFGISRERVCMHLCGDKLRISLATTHLPLKQVPENMTQDKILHCLRLTSAFTARLQLGHRPVAVCGLNPHAGEEGKMGKEEQEIIVPAIQEARAKNLDVQGPLPADTVFYRAYHGEFSAVLAMYHDQGLGPLKLVEFGSCVNITLGLPVVRTSVDHGTGYDLVGTGRAGAHSLERAVDLAVYLQESNRDDHILGVGGQGG